MKSSIHSQQENLVIPGEDEQSFAQSFDYPQD